MNIGQRPAEIKTLRANTRVANPYRAPLRWLPAALICALACAFAFRDALATGLAMGYGDSYDGDIEIAILEHWFAVLRHGAVWNSTGWFYPYPATLGFNDTDVIPGVPYALARFAGADPFLAATLAHFAMKAIGWSGMYALLRRGLGIRIGAALLGATLFATANASVLHMHHAQLLAVGIVPWMALAAITTARALIADRRRAALIRASALALLFAATAFSAFYQAWFTGFFAILFGPTAMLVSKTSERHRLLAATRRNWSVLVSPLLVGAVALLPLLAVYLPRLSEGQRHGYRAAYDYLPSLANFLNVGVGNLVWGRFIPSSWHGGEMRFGFPPGLLFTFFAALGWAVRTRRSLAAGLGLATLAAFALVLRWPMGGSAWFLVYRLLPGSDAVRVVSRFLLFALVPVIAVVAVFIDRAGLPRAAAFALGAFLLVEEVQLAAPLSLDRAGELAMLAGAGRPPAACSAFAVVSARTDKAAVMADAMRTAASWGGGDVPRQLAGRYRHNVDAMLLAAFYNVPTVNGISTFNPPDWNFANPDAPNYLARVRRYAARHRLRGLCVLDRRRAVAWAPLR